ncbi:hypothetical protein LSAT2_004392 [Lamellibrachia satsuma]|nr:hypothetical protein LSAT2_004392 [Lamellibrachia satsuma]
MPTYAEQLTPNTRHKHWPRKPRPAPGEGSRGWGVVHAAREEERRVFRLSRQPGSECGRRQTRNMTCVDVMYQPYTPYFPYQRPGPSVTGPFDHLKKYGAPRLENVASYLCSSPPITATATATVTATVTKTENEEETTDSPTPSSPTPIHTKYLSSNCAVVTYFNGDSATAVDEHFSRALSPPTSAAIYGNPAASTGDTAAMKTSWKDSGGYVNEQSSRSNRNMAERFPEKSSGCWKEQVCQGVKCKVCQGVKCKIC